MEVSYTPSFIRMLKSLPSALQEETLEKINLFRESNNHKRLRVHRLRGRLKGRYSFSVNFKTRIVFSWIKTVPQIAILHAIGDHDVYNQ